MNLPTPPEPSPKRDNDQGHNRNSPERDSTVKLVFNGTSFVPSDSTEVGRTLVRKQTYDGPQAAKAACGLCRLF